VFLLSKSERYWYDAEAVAEDSFTDPFTKGGLQLRRRKVRHDSDGTLQRAGPEVDPHADPQPSHRPGTSPTQPFAEAHFAVMPEKLVEPCVLAGCPSGGTVLDPFTGSGTVGVVACRLGRNFVGVELNPEYVAMAERRIGPWANQLQMAVTV